MIMCHMSTVFFVHNAYNLHDQTKMRCRFHFAELLSFVDAPLAGSKAECTTLANILLKTSSPTNDRHRQRCNRHSVVICI